MPCEGSRRSVPVGPTSNWRQVCEDCLQRRRLGRTAVAGEAGDPCPRDVVDRAGAGTPDRAAVPC